jgi:hypothetical protein
LVGEGTKQHLKPFGWVVLQEATHADLREFEMIESERQEELINRSPPLTSVPTDIRPLSAESSPYPTPFPPPITLRETWETAKLTYRPNDGTITAIVPNRKPAETRDKSLVPEVYRQRLFDKRKEVTATVEVEKIGNAFKIVKIE